jgi:nucleotide-binding universal stress UspA family protein
MTNGAIVVGFDESSSSRAGLEWAARHARLVGGVLRAIHVLDWPYGLDGTDVTSGRPTGRILTHDEIEDLYRGRITRLFDELHPKPDWLMQFAQGEVGPVSGPPGRACRPCWSSALVSTSASEGSCPDR